MSDHTQKSLPVEKLNALMKAHDLQEMINLARPIFGNPLILSDGSYVVMAISQEEGINDVRWNDINATKGVPMGVVTNSNVNQSYRQSLATGRPAEDINDEGLHMLRKVLSNGKQILGYLDSPLYMHLADENDIEFFDFLGNLIAMELQKDVGRAIPPDNMLDYFVYDLLEGHLTDEKLISERLEFFQWHLFAKGKMQIITIRGREGPLTPDNTFFRHLTHVFSTAFPFYRTFVYDRQLKMLCPVKDSLHKDENFAERLDVLLSKEKLVAGISRPMAHIRHITDFNRQSEKAAELGLIFQPDKTVHFYDSYAIYHALQLASGSESMFQFCHSAILRLHDYDIAHETDLLESLRVYLTHNRSIGESSSAMYIHRNTMNYRVARINELTGMDMGDPDVFCHLLFSFYALDFQNKIENISSTDKIDQWI